MRKGCLSSNAEKNVVTVHYDEQQSLGEHFYLVHFFFFKHTKNTRRATKQRYTVAAVRQTPDEQSLHIKKCKIKMKKIRQKNFKYVCFIERYITN